MTMTNARATLTAAKEGMRAWTSSEPRPNLFWTLILNVSGLGYCVAATAQHVLDEAICFLTEQLRFGLEASQLCNDNLGGRWASIMMPGNA